MDEIPNEAQSSSNSTITLANNVNKLEQLVDMMATNWIPKYEKLLKNSNDIIYVNDSNANLSIANNDNNSEYIFYNYSSVFNNICAVKEPQSVSVQCNLQTPQNKFTQVSENDLKITKQTINIQNKHT